MLPRIRTLSIVVCAILVATLTTAGSSGLALASDNLEDVSYLGVPPGTTSAAIPASLRQLTGQVEIWVRLSDPSLAQAYGEDAKHRGGRLTKTQQQSYLRGLSTKQDELMARISARGARELGRVSKAHNAVAVTIDAAQIPAVAALPDVTAIRPVVRYELDLSETVPYIGAAAVQASGVDGTGVRVAVLDSGIDYTHKNLGGVGTAAAYTAAYGTTTGDARNKSRDGLFPTAKVVAGFDFVGEAWSGAPTGSPPRTEDPDPIDCGPAAIPAPCAGGHGTHVADIIAGRSLDGTHKGVAPGASLLAVKVCSAVSIACSGVALLKGMDFALDPNGDGDISDAVDVVNMSLGSAYGQREDDLSEASANAVRLGVIVVASAGNSGDRPYITGAPASTPEVISVAQTHVPSAKLQLFRIVLPAAIAGDYRAVWQPWSARLTSVIEAPVQYGNGSGGNLNGCGAFPPGSLATKIVLVDRGDCGFSIKISNIATGGGLAGLIGLVLPGDPFEGAFGGGTPSVPGFMIHQTTSSLIKSQLAAGVVVVGRLDPAKTIPLAGSVVSTSSRGPNYSFNAIKPDIGAPGASVSADAGSATGETSFGGTSGASPMVAGSAALLVQKFPSRSVGEIKAVLMNTAETNIQTDPATQPGVLAPITRIGGGEVRVNRAADSGTAAWDEETRAGSLSFGYDTTNQNTTLQRKVVVRNYSAAARTYSIAPGFRYADDAASGAVTIGTPGSITVGANSSKTFNVKMTIDAMKLPTWNLNGGSRGGDGFRLQGFEFDGYITLTGGGDTVRLAWQVLPHKAAAVDAEVTFKDKDKDKDKDEDASGMINLSNKQGAVAGRLDVFALTGRSEQIKRKLLPQPGDNFAIIDLKSVGVRMVSLGVGVFGAQFAVNTFGERAHPNYPAEFDIHIDKNRDGTPEFIVFNSENGGFAVTGQNVVSVFNVATGAFSGPFSFTDADLNSANAILTAPLSAIGLAPNTQFNFSVFAVDNYFTGELTDSIQNMTFTLETPRFSVSGIPAAGVPVGGTAKASITTNAGGAAASPSQSGLLLLFRDGRLGKEAKAIELARRDRV